VLAVPWPAGLTEPRRVGKTGAAARSKQGMTTRQTHPVAACLSPGPPVEVVAWRTCRLREAGFPPTLAEGLAAGRVDLHALLQLVDAGCPPELAARILSPDGDTTVSR
jgi:hypothetical protein